MGNKAAFYSDLAARAFVDPDWSFADVSRAERAAYTHGYHRYPAKFIPQLVDKALEDYGPSQEALVLDPFCGSGTTLVCSLLRGHRAAGADINPLATLITEVKARPIDPEKLEHRLKSVRGLVGSPSPSPIIPEAHEDLILKWFPQENIYRLGHILGHIMAVQDPEIQMFLKVAFSHILKPSSWWNDQSTKPQKQKDKKPRNAEELFLAHLDVMADGNAAYWDAVPLILQRSHIPYQTIPRHPWLTKLGAGKVGMIVTSPPYCTSYEYLSIHQLSIGWLNLGGVDAKVKSFYIGSNCRAGFHEKPTSQLALQTVARLKEKSVKTAGAVNAYYADMERTWGEMKRVLAKGGYMVIVIGDTQLKGVPIENGAVFCEMLEDLKFNLHKVFKREIPSKLLPSTRDPKTGRFSKAGPGVKTAYPTELVLVARKM